MSRYVIIALIAALGLATVHPAKAQDFTQIENVSEVPFPVALNDINRINPKQNPAFSRGTRILRGSITDTGNKVIGDVQEITIDEEGSILAIKTDLSRIRTGGAQLSLDYEALAMRPVSSGYALGFDQNQIQNQYAEILANIGTAAGEGLDSLNISGLMGADVESAKGRRIGKVEDVLFNDTASRVEALLIRVNYRNIRGESVAVPITTPEYLTGRGRTKIRLTDEQADTVLNFAENK